MEGAGSRDISTYHLGGVMAPPLKTSIEEEVYSTRAASDTLYPLHSTADEADLNAVGNAFNVNLGKEGVNMSAEEQSMMMQSIQKIFELEEDDEEMADGDEDEDEDEEAEQVHDLNDQMRRTERLKGVLSTLAQLWWSDSEHMGLVAEKLADGSRDPKWRIPLGNSGVLNFFLEILRNNTLRHILKIQALRLIGNSCADTDENRARVVAGKYLPLITFQLRDTSLIPFAIPVLYNICIDYEPAQAQASTALLSKELIELISSPRFNDSGALIGYVCKILDLLVAQPSELELAPDNTAIVLLRLSADREHPTDMDDFIALVNTAVAYLQHVKFQQALIAQGALESTLAVLVDSYTRFDSHPSIGTPSVASSSSHQDDVKLLSEMRSNLNQVLSDVSALPEFQEAVPVISPFSSSLRRWLSSPQDQLQVCACIMLGNLARSDDACEEFVHTSQVHKPLIAVLASANDSQILHAALGFLKNLALPMKNKEALGEAGIFDVLPRLWQLDTLQQIQFSSISLARQLLIGTFANVRRAVHRLSDDTDSPANMRSILSLLITLFDRTDVEPIKMEISRLIAAVCRVFHTLTGRTPEDIDRIRKKFYTLHPGVGTPLGFMVSQTKWPAVRSEGWFVFALIARYPEGAYCISELLQDVPVFQPLVELLTGKKLLDKTPTSSPLFENSAISPTSVPGEGVSWSAQTPEAQTPGAINDAEMARIDKENALVMINELLKNRGDQMSVMRRTMFEDLLRVGSELVMSQKETASNGGTEPVSKERQRSDGINVQQVAEPSSSTLW